MSNMDTTRVMGAPGIASERTLVVPGGATMMNAPGDAMRTQMGGVATCPVCRSTTPLMDPFCGDCGFLLASAPAEEIAPPVEEKAAAELIDPQSGRRFKLRAGVNTVGRQDTDVLVNDGTVSRTHARITVANGTVTIEDLGSSNGTKVGDQRIGANAPVTATNGTNLRFGNWNVTLEFGAAPAGATIAMPAVIDGGDKTMVGAYSNEDTFIARSLIVAPAPASGASMEIEPVTGGALVGILRTVSGAADDIAVTEGVITIGRRPENTVVITGDSYVSGRHAEIVADLTGTYITDIGSTNGTQLNGQRLTANVRQLLMPGDELQIGQNRFRYATPDEVIADDDAAEPSASPSADESEREQ